MPQFYNDDIDLIPFKWSEFEAEGYKPDQKLIVIFTNNEEIIIDHDDFIDNYKVGHLGVTYYAPVRFIKL